MAQVVLLFQKEHYFTATNFKLADNGCMDLVYSPIGAMEAK